MERTKTNALPVYLGKKKRQFNNTMYIVLQGMVDLSVARKEVLNVAEKPRGYLLLEWQAMFDFSFLMFQG